MRKLLLICGALAALGLGSNAGDAMPAARLPSTKPPVTLISGGCGPYRHRGFFGYCRLNLIRPNGPPGFYRPFRFYRPFMFIRRPFFFRGPP